MGIVFMAEQEQPVRRKVALKIIKPGMDSTQVIARFEAERQALALMDHQNIARVLDAGTTASGRPYFVMELVKGVPITKFCDDNHLTPRERLELFVPVCQAIQHAHQKGIIHRDIKPSNVLVTLYDGKPVPKVIDFGVAKAIEQRLTERTLFTQIGQVVGTLEYMSPEQAEINALDIDTRSDIYSLGVLLYELLTGSTPLEKQKLRSAAFQEMLRMIREEEPPKPSTRLSASRDQLASISAHRKTEPAKLTKLVRGELDWIVMKSLEKDRCRRYETANGFARDIQRYLADEPVEACPPSTAYKLRKFARKNKTLLRTAAAFILLLTIGALVSTWQAIRATNAEIEALKRADAEREARLEEKAAKERESEALAATKKALNDVEAQRSRAEANFAKALAVVDDYLTKVSESQLLKTPGMQPLRRELLASALKFYDGFLKERAGDPTIRAELASAYYRVGRVQRDLGASKEATQAINQAVALLEQLVKDNPENLSYKADLARSYHLAGNHAQAIALGKKLVAADPANVQFRSELAETYNSLGRTSTVGSDEQFQAYQEALALREVLARERFDDPEVQSALAQTLNNLAVVLSRKGRKAEARDMYLRAAKYCQITFEKAPWNLRYGRILAISTNNVALMHRNLGNNDEALRWHERALRVRKHLAESNPAVPDLWEDLFGIYLTITDFQRNFNHPTEAARWQRLARDAIERVPREEASNLYLLSRARARCAESIGWGKKELTSAEKTEQQHEADLALDALRKAVAAGLKDVAKLNNNQDFAVLRERTDFKALLVKLATSAGQTATVLNANEVSSLMAAQKKQAAADPENRQLQADLAASQHALGLIQLDLGKMEEAEKHLDHAATVRVALVKDEPKNAQYQADLTSSRGYLHLVRARRLTEQKRNKEAEAALAKIEDFPFNDGQVYRERGRTYFALGQTDKATADFRKAVELLDERALELLASPSEPATSEADKLSARLADDALLPKLTAAIERNPDDMARRWSRAEWYARHRRWKEAAADFQIWLERQPLENRSGHDAWHWQHTAPTLVAAGDREGYRRLCREMLKRFGDTQDPITAARIAWACLLLPASGKDMDLACQLADRSVTLGKKGSDDPGIILCKGLADYRRENHRAAAEALDLLASRTGDDLSAICHLILTMACYRQGDAKAAREHLTKAAKFLDQHVSDPARFPHYPGFRYHHDWLTASLLHREAQTTDPQAYRERGRTYFALGQADKATADFGKSVELLDDKALEKLLAEQAASEADKLLARLADDALLAKLTAAIERSPDDTARRWSRGEWYARHRRWKEAAADLQPFLERQPLESRSVHDAWPWAFAAPILVAAGDREVYRRLCREMLKRFGDTQEPYTAERIAKACLLLPASGKDRDLACQLADRTVTLGKKSGELWFIFGKGLADYRRGNYRAAAEALDPLASGGSGVLHVNCRLILAMACYRQGDAKAARQHLTEAAKLLDQNVSDPGRFPVFPGSLRYQNDWLIALLLHREAQTLIEGAKDESKK
jgi:tetratricopeptide (TPR) repeat protein